MKALYTLIAALLLTLSFMFGQVRGYLKAHRQDSQKLYECLSKYSWVTDGDVCKYIGAKSYKWGTCMPSMRVSRAYASHKALWCVVQGDPRGGDGARERGAGSND